MVRQSVHALNVVRALAVALVLVVAVPGAASAAKGAPDTVIDSGPANPTNKTSASFAFHSTDKTATFTCRLDGSAWVPCSSPTSIGGLAAGAHAFAVDSTAGGVADPTPATYSWTVDVNPPTAPANLAGSAPTSTSIALTWSAGTDASGITANIVLRDGATLVTIGNVASYTDSTVLAGSTHSYAIEAEDAAGNFSAPSNSVSVTTPPPPSAPDTIIDSGPLPLTNTTSATFAFHSTLTGATFTCKLDSARAAACTSPKAFTGLAAGAHAFSVFATANGISDPSPATASWTIDTTPPSVPAAPSASATANSVTLSWTASTDNISVAGYDVYRGGSKLASVTSGTTYVDGSVLVGTTYTYTVDAFDGAGNISPQSSAVAARPMASYAAQLTRAPYLTDLVDLHVAINWATDQSGTSGSVSYGQVGAGGACSPTTQVAASRITISVGTVLEYQWKGDVTLPSTGTYCYRIFLGSTDLLGSNAAPTFTTQVQFGATDSYSFVVFGDWGQVDATGQNAGQAQLMAQIAGSGARFAVSVGDNGYTNGSQINYGDLQQSGADTSAIFGSQFWTVPGSSMPLFTAVGNHGVSGVHHTDITTWTQAYAVSKSGGRYQNDVYCCINGTTSSNYGSEWYAFSAGNARFYILDSAWGDLNAGTATPYANDALAHFAPGTPEYSWLVNDLNTHPTQLKFAFSHYPFYSDNNTQPSDTYLEGPANLEGLLAQHGVQIVFNGHAHIYERNKPSAGGMPITYVTGGGGATPEPVGPCNGYDAYAIGWSPTSVAGSACGVAAPPTSGAQVFHFLKVTVSGTSVTVAPTDSTGKTFDVQTYTFKVATDTYMDSAPPIGTASTSATFAFHASGSPATFKCQLDALSQTSCTSPITYNNLAQGRHTFKVAATYNKSIDPTPATAAWTVDYTNPTAPSSLVATATNPFNVGLSWSPASDNTGVTGYDVFRDGNLYQTLGAVTTYADAVLGGSTHQYAVRARDIAGNASPLTASATVTTPPPPPPVFSDGFESGGLGAWSSSGGLTVESATVNNGQYAAEGNTSNGGTFARETLPGTYGDAYARVWSDIIAQPSQVNLLRLRDSTGASVGYLYVDTTGLLGFHNDSTGTNQLSGFSPSPGWHALELHVKTDPAAGVVEIWVDNLLVSDLGGSGLNTGALPIGAIQIGEVQSGRTYDVVFDDAGFGTSRLGPAPDLTPPSAPTGLTATVAGPFEADLTWTASTDNVGVAGYNVYRDGGVVATLGNVLSYADTSTIAGLSHTYAVIATDASGNASAPSAAVTVVQPPAAPPLFADGFEGGDLSAWTNTAGLTVESSEAKTGAYGVEANTTTGATFAKESFASSYQDAYARVAFRVVTDSSQLTLLRLRDTPTGNGGYVYLTPGGKLGFRSDAMATGTTSSVGVGPGWHVLELHLLVNGAASSVGVWLDGAPVSDLTATTDLGAVAGIGVLQIGETSSGTWDLFFDDAGFGTARLGPVTDTSPPTVPGNFAASAAGPFSVDVTWDASTDNVGVTGYDVVRDGAVIGDVASPGFTDNTVLPGSTHAYAVRARDASGNVSAPSPTAGVTLPAAPPPLWADGFETGDTSAWTGASNLAVETTDVHSGAYAAEGNTTTGGTFARETLPATYTDAYARVAFEVKSQASQVTLLRLRDTPTGSGGYLYVTSGGKLGFRSDALPAGTTSSVAPGSGWHVIELHLHVSGAASAVDVWLDGSAVSDLTFTSIDLGPIAGIGVVQIGDTATSGTWDVLMDDAGFGTSRLGPSGDTSPPTVPANVNATATSAFSVQLAWDPSTDNVGVTGYDVLRNGLLLAHVTSPGYTDGTVLANSLYTYAVRARDAAGNVSDFSPATGVLTPIPPTPVFADGFETGDMSSWTTSAGLAIESGDVNNGVYAVEGNTVTGSSYAKKTLGSTYPNAYARVAFEVYSQGTQTTLLRLRDTPTGNGGYIYMTAGGKLAFRSDALTAGTTSAVVVAPGWHVVELHLSLNGAASVVEVWLDGVAVPDLTFSSIDLGAVAGIGVLQIGDSSTSGTWDVALDDAAFGTSRLGPTGDVNPPTVPANVNAAAISPFSVSVTWDASTDDVGVAGYDLFRNGQLLAQVATPGYVDNTVLAATSYQYAVRARDASGNVSALSAGVSVTTPSAPTPLFADGFETADLSAWTTAANLSVEATDVRSGYYAAEGATTTGVTNARKTLGATYQNAYARVAFEVKSQSGQVTLLRLRDTPTGSGGYLLIAANGKLGFHDDATNVTTLSGVAPGPGWHAVELHLFVNGASSTVEVWLDGAAVPDLTWSVTTLGTSPIGVLQIGDTSTTGTWDVVFDDAAFATSRLGPSGDVDPPTVPANLTATATTPFSVSLNWTASTDNVAVTSYDVFRDGILFAQVASPGFTDKTVLNNTTHYYAVRARDASNNVSAVTPLVGVTTPQGAPPIFADGFESGTMSAWTSSTGLVVETSTVHLGTYAAEGTTIAGNTYARESLPATYSDAYARVSFDVVTGGSQMRLLWLRDSTGKGGYIAMTATGKLQFHNDTTGVSTSSATAASSGWHVLELHLLFNGTSSTVEVWLDGSPVTDLTQTNADLHLTTAISVLQVGDSGTSGTWDVVYDDAAFATARLGLP